jgi:hypothetical protein
VQQAIDRVHHDLINALESEPETPADMENGPSEKDFIPHENRQEDITFYTTELARLINMRNELLNWEPTEAWLAREMNAG